VTTPSQIGAFFDLDGTLLSWPSLEWRFIAYLASRDILGPATLARSLSTVVANAANGLPLAHDCRMYLAGLSTSLVDDWLADQPKALPVFDDGLRRLEWHASQGHRIAIVSGTLAPLARAFAWQLQVPVEIYATELETVSRVSKEGSGFAAHIWIGELASEWPNGLTKARIVRSLAANRGLDLSRSFAYGNSAADAAMLSVTGYPRAVNPSLCLRRIAARRRWIVEYWRARTDAHEFVRSRSLTTARFGGHR